MFVSQFVCVCVCLFCVVCTARCSKYISEEYVFSYWGYKYRSESCKCLMTEPALILDYFFSLIFSVWSTHWWDCDGKFLTSIVTAFDSSLEHMELLFLFWFFFAEYLLMTFGCECSLAPILLLPYAEHRAVTQEPIQWSTDQCPEQSFNYVLNSFRGSC